MANQKLNIDIVAKDKSKQAFNRLQGTLSKVKASVFNLKNAFIGLGAGLVLKGIVNAGMQIEELGVQLEALFGSAKKGQEALDAVTKFAKTTPFELSNHGWNWRCSYRTRGHDSRVCNYISRNCGRYQKN